MSDVILYLAPIIGLHKVWTLRRGLYKLLINFDTAIDERMGHLGRDARALAGYFPRHFSLWRAQTSLTESLLDGVFTSSLSQNLHSKLLLGIFRWKALMEGFGSSLRKSTSGPVVRSSSAPQRWPELIASLRASVTSLGPKIQL